MPNHKNEKSIIVFEIENIRIYITLDDGFFNLEKIESAIHSHTRYEFHLALFGNTCIETGHGCYILENSEGYIILPGTLHTCRQDENKSIKSSFWFSFEKNGKKTQRDIYGIFSKAFENIDGVTKIENAYKYTDILKEIMHLFYSNNIFATEEIKNLFSLLMLKIVTSLLPQKTTAENTLYLNSSAPGAERNLRRIIIEEYINRNYHKEITLETMAHVLHLSKKQTARVFEGEFSENFKSYISKFRINIAMRYLKEKDLSLLKIANLVGYKSYNGFYKSFLSLTGKTPEEYRQNN